MTDPPAKKVVVEPLMIASSSSPFPDTLQMGELSYQLDGDDCMINEVKKLGELSEDSHRRMVLGHAAASLAFVADLLLSPNTELSTTKKENEDLKGENLKLKEEITRLIEETS